MTAARNDSQDDLKLQMSFYAEDLAAYPMDAIKAAVRSCIDHTDGNVVSWFPTWGELRDSLNTYAGKRMAAMEALENAR